MQQFCATGKSLVILSYIMFTVIIVVFSLMCILKKQTVFRMPWNSSYIFLTKSNEPMLENLKQILQGVSSLVLKIVFCVHLGKLHTIEGLTTFFL